MYSLCLQMPSGYEKFNNDLSKQEKEEQKARAREERERANTEKSSKSKCFFIFECNLCSVSKMSF